MAFKIEYCYNFPWKYLHAIPENEQKAIKYFIEAKLAKNIGRMGQSLNAVSDNLWKARLGKYKIIYKVVPDKITILAIRNHKRVDLYR